MIRVWLELFTTEEMFTGTKAIGIKQLKITTKPFSLIQKPLKLFTIEEKLTG
jgi:hypothetical protein